MPVLATHRFTTKEYYRMAETGLLRPDARVELLDGQIIDMSPIGPLHSGLVNRLTHLFARLPKGRYLVAVQNPVHLDEHSEPQPDLMLLKPKAGDYTDAHPKPADVLLLIEISDTSLHYDREEKLPAYGRAGISEVWIVNALERNIEIYRDPHLTGYGSATVLRAGDKASPLAFPDLAVDVAELMRSA
jgi:Uma2 family endonuclease